MNVLLLQKRLLFPVDTGGKVRTLQVVRHLAQWHKVTYLCNLSWDEQPFVPEMERLGVRVLTVPWREAPRGSLPFYRDLVLNVLSPYPFNVDKDYDPKLRGKAIEMLATDRFDLVICDFVQMARNAMGLPGPPKVLFQHNVEAEIFQRHAGSDKGWLRRRYMGLQWRKMRRFEAEAGRQFDAVIAVSDRDKRIFEQQYGWDHVHAIDTAVDLDYFQESGHTEQPDRLVFVGSMDWLPNADGVKFFLREVWPRIRQARPHAKFQIVGRNPSAGLKRLADVPGVEVTGTVPDVRPYFAGASVVVVPLLVGGGTRLKIFEAMAMGKPVVSTSLGAEGLKVTPGEHIELADDPRTFAQKVISLLSDANDRHHLGERGRQHVCQHFSAEAVARQFEAICLKVIEQRKREPLASDRDREDVNATESSFIHSV